MIASINRKLFRSDGLLLLFALLYMALMGGCDQRHDKIDWYKNAASRVFTLEDANRILGKPAMIFQRNETILRIKQFNPGAIEAKLNTLNLSNSYFYSIDPDNTLIIGFNERGQVETMFFGGQ